MEMEIVQNFKYPIKLVTRCTTYPVYIMNRVPFFNKEDATLFIEGELEDECEYRKGTYIAVPYKGSVLVPRERDTENLQRAWDNAYKAIHEATSRTIKCKICESSYVRERVKVQCPMCFGILGSNTNANRINKCREKMKDYCVTESGLCHLIVKL